MRKTMSFPTPAQMYSNSSTICNVDDAIDNSVKLVLDLAVTPASKSLSRIFLLNDSNAESSKG